MLTTVLLLLFSASAWSPTPTETYPANPAKELVPAEGNLVPSVNNAIGKVAPSVGYLKSDHGRWHDSGTGILISRDGYIKLTCPQ